MLGRRRKWNLKFFFWDLWLKFSSVFLWFFFCVKFEWGKHNPVKVHIGNTDSSDESESSDERDGTKKLDKS